MKLHIVAAAIQLLSVVNAVNMINYRPSSGVEPAFFQYLLQLYASTEDSLATRSFYDYFAPPGNLTIVNSVNIGYDAIIKEKFNINPPQGYKRLNHFPNITNIYNETATQKVYFVQGIIQTTNLLPTVLNCSQAYYSSRFTVLKNGQGQPNLIAHGGGLVIYNDYIVDPLESPTNIPCSPLGNM